MCSPLSSLLAIALLTSACGSADDGADTSGGPDTTDGAASGGGDGADSGGAGPVGAQASVGGVTSGSGGAAADSGGVAASDTGSDGVGDIAWFVENASGEPLVPGLKLPNAYGLYDLLGNVSEWVEDCYHETYAGAPTDGSAWVEDGCEYYVLRGGCYGSTARLVRASVREPAQPDVYGTCVPTVRCVRSVRAAVPAEFSALASVAEIAWASIPGGTYLMGCSAGDEDCYPNEESPHSVTVQPFEMMTKEPTQQQFYDVSGRSPGSFTRYCAECSESHVVWGDGKSFCALLGGRLPTEAEWEFAARGGKAAPYYTGSY